MPSVEIFISQDADYKQSVLGDRLPVFTLEAGVTGGWSVITANGGVAIGIDRFGASAPADVLADKFGFTAEAVVDLIVAALDGEESR
jgi:transketolase